MTAREIMAIRIAHSHALAHVVWADMDLDPVSESALAWKVLRRWFEMLTFKVTPEVRIAVQEFLTENLLHDELQAQIRKLTGDE